MNDLATLAISRELATRGAQAVVLSGSWARGDAHPESDLDLYALGEGPEYALERRDRYLVSVSWRTVEQVRESFRSPAEVCTSVPGWQGAIPLYDPSGLAAQLRNEALEWSWDIVGEEHCDRYVAEWLTGLAEEVHKLVAALDHGSHWTAAVNRSILALRLAPMLALHFRMLYGSENYLWDLVAGRMPPEWARAQGCAFADKCQEFDVTCRAALELYILASEEVRHLLDDAQAPVVRHACGLVARVVHAQPMHDTV